MSVARALAVTAAALALAVSLAACGAEEPGPGATLATDTAGDAEADVKRFVEQFLDARVAGEPVDELMAADAAAAYAEHDTGLWLYDDTFPGGPGGLYEPLSVTTELGAGGAWSANVRIRITWLGDSPPSEIVEVLTVGPGRNVAGEEKPLVVREAVRSDAADEGLPLPVAEMREDIYRAAVKHDYGMLRSLLDPETFSYSFGENGDPIGYWREQEAGHLPLVGDILPGVLHTRFAERDGIYMWPSAAAKEPAVWTDEDRDAIRAAGYTDEDIRSFEQFGGYLGWRAGIRADGTWLFFISGD